MKLVSVTEMQAIEKEADASGLSYAQMMENAGQGLAEIIRATYGSLPDRAILALVGSGNNGGDALVALAYLASWGWRTSAYLVRPRSQGDPLLTQYEAAGGVITSAEDDPARSRLAEALRAHAILLDGVLGTGARLPLKSEVAQPLQFVQETLRGLSKRPRIVAVDCPSGVDCDSGEVADEALAADLTVTMAAVKRGLLSFPAYNLVGELRLTGIGLPDDGLPTWKAVGAEVVEAAEVRKLLPARPLAAHKGTFGTALVVAGSINYSGAALLAGEAAYRIGSGLVTIGIPTPLHTALAGYLPEATWLLLPHDTGVIAPPAEEVVRKGLANASSLLIGPGFGVENPTRDFVARLFTGADARRTGIGFVHPAETPAAERLTLPPLVVDADGLKLLAQLPDWPAHLPEQTVLTPHPGEMSILTGLSKNEIQADRLGIAKRFSREWNCVVVLKGAFTVIAAPGEASAIIPVASPALARAGTGDVLAGLITGLLAQGLKAYPAAKAGAWIHAQAGLAASEIMGSTAAVLAGDVLRHVALIIKRLD